VRKHTHTYTYTSYIIHHTSYIIHHTSYIIHHASFIHHTSYIKQHAHTHTYTHTHHTHTHTRTHTYTHTHMHIRALVDTNDALDQKVPAFNDNDSDSDVDSDSDHDDQDDISEEDAWSIISSFLGREGKGLVAAQLDSFNEFISTTIQEIIEESLPIEYVHHATDNNASEDLRVDIERKNVWALNENVPDSGVFCLKEWNKRHDKKTVLRSRDGIRLMLFIPFKTSVKLESFSIIGASGGKSASHLKM